MQISQQVGIKSKIKQDVVRIFFDVFSWGILVLSFLPIAVFVYIGWYVRYFADDFSTAGILSQEGFWRAQVFWYLSWTGSYLYTFLISLLELGGDGVVRWLPGVVMGLWVILLIAALKNIFQLLNVLVSNLWIAILTGVIIFCTIKSFSDYTQVIFWQTGIIAYQSNLLVFLLIAIYFVRRFPTFDEQTVTRQEYVVMFVVFFIVGGISETWIIMQIALFALGMFALMFERRAIRGSLFHMLANGFMASWLALFVTLIAPGNTNHSAVMDELSLGRIFNYLLVSLVDVPRFLYEWARDRTTLFALITLTGFVGGFSVEEQTNQAKSRGMVLLRTVVLALLAACFMLWMGFFPGYTVFGVRPPDRAIFTAMFIFLWIYGMVCLLIGWSIRSLFSQTAHSWSKFVLILGLAILIYFSPVQTASSQFKLIPVFQLYAQLWDSRDTLLRLSAEQGHMDVVVVSIRRNRALSDLGATIWLLGELEENPANWKNQAAANYYNLNSITGEK